MALLDYDVDFVTGKWLLEIIAFNDPRFRNRMQLEKDESISLRIIERFESRNLLERVVRMQILERAGVDVVPGGPPAGLVVSQFGAEIRKLRSARAEVIAE